MKDSHRLALSGVRIESSPNVGMVAHHKSESSLVFEAMYKKHLGPLFMELKESILGKINESFSQGGDRVLRYQGRLCVPNMDDLSSWILKEAHRSRYPIHPNSTMMYHDPLHHFRPTTTPIKFSLIYQNVWPVIKGNTFGLQKTVFHGCSKEA